jgi:outer membrane receptor protein involved in Fe transport
VAWLYLLSTTAAQESAPQNDPQSKQASSQPTPTTTFTVIVVGTTPLEGVELPVDRIAAPVQTVTGKEIANSGALDLADFLDRRVNGVHVNETQGNPFQPDVNYRGYTASPLLGTPQGLSVYMDGVRMNQPFGDVVSWDFIPRVAILSTALMPGSNPVFGLNTLGGALSIQTKDGRNSAGTTVQAIYGSSMRRALEFEHGGNSDTKGIDWYLAGNLFAEDGWRAESPSEVRQFFGKLGWRPAAGELSVTVAHADNSLTGNGLQEIGFLDRDYTSVYTTPDVNDNRSTLLNVAARRDIEGRITVSANAYYRNIRTGALNGDINEESLDADVYLPGENPANTPFPFRACLAGVQLNGEPAETCNGLVNRTQSSQHNAGASGQITRRTTFDRGGNQFTAGTAYDHSTTDFTQSTELGYLEADRSVTGTGAFADGVTGGDIDGEPFDARVDLDGVIDTWSLFAANTVSLAERWHVSLSGRFNRTTVDNTDGITAAGEPGSLDGHHVFSRFNPAAGVTFNPSPRVNVYAGYSEGSRAPTSIELGCADPEQPCKLPNAMAGDPPLEQVVTRTVEAGVRGRFGGADWHGGFFLARNSDDILFVMAEQTGFGYFRNFGGTRRQGIELGVNAQAGRVSYGAGYTLLDATFQSEETVNGGSNSTNDAAEAGAPGLEGSIEIEPGNTMPLAPRHMLKLFADAQLTAAFGINADLSWISSSYARGNENNRHEPDGTHYLGDGTAPGYIVVNLGARYRFTPWLEILGQVENLFDRRYYTGAQLSPLGFTDNETFIARPLPEVDGEYPLGHSTFYAPGAPIRAWISTRFIF